MPIYEFYCEDCHTLFSFLAASSDVDRHPSCPRCGRGELPKRPSTFATLNHASEDDEDVLGGLDDTRLDRAMDTLMREMGDVGEDADPAQVGRFFRRFGELSGLEMGPRMEEALSRLEAGEDPDALESELEALDEDESLQELFRLRKAACGRRSRRPGVDPELYFL